MDYGLGVDLGTTFTAAAVRRGDDVEVVRLGARRAEVPSVVFLAADGTVLVGEPAARRGAEEPGRVAREFKRRLGDPVPVLVGGAPYSAHALMARQLEHVVRTAVANEGSAPSSVVVTCPANWGPYKRDLVLQAARLADLPEARLASEPEAAAVEFAAGERVGEGEIIAVYDLGGGTFDAAVLRRTASGFELLGTPEGIEQLGGIDFDEAVFEHVMTTLGGAAAGLAAEDADARAALVRLRRDCVEAKEALSEDTEVLVPVALPGLHTRVRLTRTEFEAMIAPALEDTVGAMRRALRSAGLGADQLRAILLAGGSSRIPLVTQVLGAAFDRPTVLDPHPEHGVALGAARLTGRAASQSSAPAPAPVPASAPSALTPTPVAVQAPVTQQMPRQGRIHAAAPVSSSPVSSVPTRVAAASPVRGPANPAPPPTDASTPALVPAPDEPAGKNRWPRILLAAAAVLVIAGSVATVVRLAGRDAGGQTPLTAGPASSAAASPTPAACGFTEGFDGNQLAAAWQRTRKDAALTVARGTVTMAAPEGADIYEAHLDAPRLQRPTSGNFVAQTDVTARPRQFYQGAGLVLWVDPEHYARVELGHNGTYGEIIFEYKNAAKHKRVLKPGLGPDHADTDRVVLELAREGSALHARWRPATETAWRVLGQITMTLPARVQVGVAVLNRAQGNAKPAPFSAAFDSVTVTC